MRAPSVLQPVSSAMLHRHRQPRLSPVRGFLSRSGNEGHPCLLCQSRRIVFYSFLRSGLAVAFRDTPSANALTLLRRLVPTDDRVNPLTRKCLITVDVLRV